LTRQRTGWFLFFLVRVSRLELGSRLHHRSSSKAVGGQIFIARFPLLDLFSTPVSAGGFVLSVSLDRVSKSVPSEPSFATTGQKSFFHLHFSVAAGDRARALVSSAVPYRHWPSARI
jgi:hypothetical protein